MHFIDGSFEMLQTKLYPCYDKQNVTVHPFPEAVHGLYFQTDAGYIRNSRRKQRVTVIVNICM